MKRLSVIALALVALSAAACSDDSPTTPTDNNTIKFTAALLPSNEVPPIVAPNADATGSGNAIITLHVTRDAGNNITAANADFAVTMQTFPANTSVTLAHIHPGRPGINGGAIVSLNLGAGEIVLNGSGAGSINRTAITVPVDIATSMIADPIGYYFNVHTQLNGGGAIRGQLVAQ